MSWSHRFSYILSGVAAAAIAAGLAGVLYVHINTVAAERDGAVRGLGDERSRASRLQADLGQMKQDYERGLADERSRAGRLQADLDQLKGSKEAVEREGVEIREREAAAVRQFEAAKDAFEKSRTASMALEGELKTVQAKLGALEKDRDGWRTLAGETETSLKRSREALEAAEKEKDSWRTRAEKAERELEKAKGALAERDEEIRKLQGRSGEPAAR
jgi:chromosome segregation ATPase